MTEDNVFDFDAFRQEQEAKQLDFKINGKLYKMAPTLPAAMVLKIVRMRHTLGEDAEVTLEVFDEFGRSVFGTEEWQSLLRENQIGFMEMPRLIEGVIRAYAPKGVTIPDLTSETDESSSASSNPGPGSSPTSEESTESTSS
jgi:hypothetical protein